MKKNKQIPLPFRFPDKANQDKILGDSWQKAIANTHWVELLSMEPSQLRGKKFRKIYRKAQEAMGELGKYINPPLGKGFVIKGKLTKQVMKDAYVSLSENDPTVKFLTFYQAIDSIIGNGWLAGYDKKVEKFWAKQHK